MIFLFVNYFFFWIKIIILLMRICDNIDIFLFVFVYWLVDVKWN